MQLELSCNTQLGIKPASTRGHVTGIWPTCSFLKWFATDNRTCPGSVLSCPGIACPHIQESLFCCMFRRIPKVGNPPLFAVCPCSACCPLKPQFERKGSHTGPKPIGEPLQPQAAMCALCVCVRCLFFLSMGMCCFVCVFMFRVWECAVGRHVWSRSFVLGAKVLHCGEFRGNPSTLKSHDTVRDSSLRPSPESNE